MRFISLHVMLGFVIASSSLGESEELDSFLLAGDKFLRFFDKNQLRTSVEVLNRRALGSFIEIECGPEETEIRFIHNYAKFMAKQFGVIERIRLNTCERQLGVHVQGLTFDNAECRLTINGSNQVSIQTAIGLFEETFFCPQVKATMNGIQRHFEASKIPIEQNLRISANETIIVDRIPLDAECWLSEDNNGFNKIWAEFNNTTCTSFHGNEMKLIEFADNRTNEAGSFRVKLNLRAMDFESADELTDLQMICSQDDGEDLHRFRFSVIVQKRPLSLCQWLLLVVTIFSISMIGSLLTCYLVWAFFFLDKRRYAFDDTSNDPDGQPIAMGNEADIEMQEVQHDQHMCFSYVKLMNQRPELKIVPERLKKICELGMGSFGKAFKARMLPISMVRYSRLLDYFPAFLMPGQLVVVKLIIHGHSSRKDCECFHHKRRALVKLFEAPERPGKRFIVSLIGFHTRPGNQQIILELCNRTDLGSFIRENRVGSAIEKAAKKTGSKVKLLLKNQIKWMHELCLALDFLARNRVVHRDVALRNVFLKGNLETRLGDLGLARLFSEGQDFYQGPLNEELPPMLTPPEASRNHRCNEATDVYGFGALAWELQWYAGARQACEDQRPRFPMSRHPDAPKIVYDLIQWTWVIHPTDRPSFLELASIFEKILGKFNATNQQMDAELLDGHCNKDFLLRQSIRPNRFDEKKTIMD